MSMSSRNRGSEDDASRSNQGSEAPDDDKENLLDKLNCPICSDILKTPIFQCCEGHVLCGGCHEKMKKSTTNLPIKCPHCKVDMNDNRARFLEDLTGSVPAKCHHDGCGKVLKREDLDEHHRHCEFRPITCPFCLEQVEGGWDHLWDYIRNNHEPHIGKNPRFDARLLRQILENPDSLIGCMHEATLGDSAIPIVLLIRYFTEASLYAFSIFDLAEQSSLKCRIEVYNDKSSFGRDSLDAQSYRALEGRRVDCSSRTCFVVAKQEIQFMTDDYSSPIYVKASVSSRNSD